MLLVHGLRPGRFGARCRARSVSLETGTGFPLPRKKLRRLSRFRPLRMPQPMRQRAGAAGLPACRRKLGHVS